MTKDSKNPAQNYQPGPGTASDPNLERDSEDRQLPSENKRAIQEKNLDKTIADSFPTSDPPSTIPNPGEEEDAA
jgi:hypothetical protein